MRQRLVRYSSTSALFFALALSGCIVVGGGVDDATQTCNAFDQYLGACYPSCAATWDCEYWYDPLPVDTQLLLDDCADCLAANRDLCLDCAAGRESCHYLLEAYLGISCVW